MHFFWLLLFFSNLGVLYYFFKHPDLILATRLEWIAKMPEAMSAYEYTIYFGGFVLAVNIVMNLILKNLHGTKFLKYAVVPNKKYWCSSPDRRLDAIAKLQDLFSAFGFVLNFIFLDINAFVFAKTFYVSVYSSSMILQSCLMAAGGSVFFLIIYLIVKFRVPKA